MFDLIISILSAATVSTLLTGALLWLTKSWISERLKNAIKHEYDEKLESHKAQLKAESDTTLERLKSQLQVAGIHAHSGLGDTVSVISHLGVEAAILESAIPLVDQQKVG